MNEVRFSVKEIQGVPVVVTPEEIDITNAVKLRAALLDAASRGHRTVVVDMSGTRFCDTAGLHALVGAHRRAEAEGKRVLLVVAANAVLRILTITGLDTLLARFASLDDALAAASPAASPKASPAAQADRRIGPEGTIEVRLGASGVEHDLATCLALADPLECLVDLRERYG